MSNIVLTLSPTRVIGLTLSAPAQGSIEFVPATAGITLQLAPFFKGDKGDQGIQGTTGGSYTHAQGVASAVWWITHGLNKSPSVTIQDSAGDTVDGDVTYTDPNNLVITFSAAFGGTAYLN